MAADVSACTAGGGAAAAGANGAAGAGAARSGLSGAGAATLQILGQSLLALTEAALLLVIAATLIWVNPVVALASIAFFALVGVSLQAILGHRSSRIGVVAAETEIESLQTIQEAMGAYREITVADRRRAYVGRLERLRFTAARMIAEGQFIGIFPKYLFEVALVIGGLLLAAFLFNTQPFESAVAQFAVFIAAATRVMPSILRLQGSAIILRGSASVARHAYELAESLDVQETLSQVSEFQDAPNPLNDARAQSTFSASLQVRNLSFWYPNQAQPAVSEVSFFAKAGERLAIVGRSGAGKSTLADLILGILNPAEGEILIGGSNPTTVTRDHPGAVAYVPQSVLLANATIRENVALGLDRDSICDDLVWEALEGAHLSRIVEASEKGIETIVGEGGYKLSGGQRQRLGIARALYTRPKLLVLDEATSSLDVETESEIEASMSGLDQDVTVVTIAHRLSTIRSATTILYLEEGRLRAIGSFAQVRESVPEFDRQLNLSFIN